MPGEKGYWFGESEIFPCKLVVNCNSGQLFNSFIPARVYARFFNIVLLYES